MGVNRKAQVSTPIETGPDSPDVLSKATESKIGTVLIVEDSDAVRESTAEILRAAGFDVLEASDGTTAMWLMASERVDVLLLDLHLCRQHGTTVLEALEDSSTVVVFSAFGYFEEKEIRQAFGSTIFDCLRKPVQPARLIDVVAAASLHARAGGGSTTVKPIEPRMAIRLAMMSLAHMTPETDRDEQEKIHNDV